MDVLRLCWWSLAALTVDLGAILAGLGCSSPARWSSATLTTSFALGRHGDGRRVLPPVPRDARARDPVRLDQAAPGAAACALVASFGRCVRLPSPN